jgi:subtilisin family serine protease
MKADGKGNEMNILHGIDWALQNKCRIISLSLGKAVAKGQAADSQYEEIGRIALEKNCLIVAAAGNDSNRNNNDIEPVSIPANSSKILAVGAIDRKMAIYDASNGGINAGGGGVDIAAPGVEVYSSKISSKKSPANNYGTETGTSMATPHVAGIAALLMQHDPSATAEQIWTRLTQSAKRLTLPSRDVGSGLVNISI